jgi:hypothetical protein
MLFDASGDLNGVKNNPQLGKMANDVSGWSLIRKIDKKGNSTSGLAPS